MKYDLSFFLVHIPSLLFLLFAQDRLPRGQGFEQSFTDKVASSSSSPDSRSSALASVVSDERTSTFFHLRKFGDAKVYDVQARPHQCTSFWKLLFKRQCHSVIVGFRVDAGCPSECSTGCCVHCSLEWVLPHSSIPVIVQVRAIEARAAELMGIPAGQVEPLQVVSYRDGQHFSAHHDAGTLESDDDDDYVEGRGEREEGKDGVGGSSAAAAPGNETTVSKKEDEDKASKKYKVALVAPRRLVTFFVYLNTLPPGVGATHFPALGLHVQPKARSALVFCNVQPDGRPDPATVHEAQPVGEGYRKFGMNLWISDTSCLEYASATGPKAGVTFSKAQRSSPVPPSQSPQAQSSPSSVAGHKKNGSAVKARRKSGGGGGTPLAECDASAASASSSLSSSSSSSSSGSTTGWESALDGGGGGLSSGGVLSALEHFETARREVSVCALHACSFSFLSFLFLGVLVVSMTLTHLSSSLLALISPHPFSGGISCIWQR